MNEWTGTKEQNGINKNKVNTRERHELHWGAWLVWQGIWTMNCMELHKVYVLWREVYEWHDYYVIRIA